MADGGGASAWLPRGTPAGRDPISDVSMKSAVMPDAAHGAGRISVSGAPAECDLALTWINAPAVVLVQICHHLDGS